MYGFVDTTEDATNTATSIQTIFNNSNLDELLSDENGSFITLTVSGRGEQENKISLIAVTGMHGVWEENKTYREPREITVKYKIKDRTNKGIRERFEKLKSYLMGSKQVLEFTDENAIFYATLSVLKVPEEDSSDLVGTIVFLCTDPDKYGPEQTLTFPADIVTIENKGTAEANPIFELTATQKTTFVMIGNDNEEYNLIGKPAEVDEQLIDEKNLLFSERGGTLNTWTSTGTQVDGKVDGAMTTDGTGIVHNGYGTGSAWHGPALMKEITPIQDFEVEMRLRAETLNPDQAYRIEFYLFDENMNVIGKMSIWDSMASKVQYAAEGRYGPMAGKHINYPISSRNYQRNRGHFHGLIRMKRIGQQFEFYVARIGVIDDFTHHDTLTETFNDINNEYQGKLKYVQIHIGKYGDKPSANLPRINMIEAYEYNTVLDDQTPYILNVGDVVTFDHKDDDILVNGEPRSDLKNFGGSFFKLAKGENMLIVTPEDSFDTKVTFRDKFL